jgi:hypothetical protein
MKFYSKEKHNAVVAKGEARLGQQHFIGYNVTAPHSEKTCIIPQCMVCFNIKLDHLLAMQEASIGTVIVSDIEWQG